MLYDIPCLPTETTACLPAAIIKIEENFDLQNVVKNFELRGVESGLLLTQAAAIFSIECSFVSRAKVGIRLGRLSHQTIR